MMVHKNQLLYNFELAVLVIEYFKSYLIPYMFAYVYLYIINKTVCI